jgi:hypothetical protein
MSPDPVGDGEGEGKILDGEGRSPIELGKFWRSLPRVLVSSLEVC